MPVTDRGGLLVYEILMIQHFLENRFTDGGEVINLTRRPLLYFPEILFL
jgi:hypothetical protein